MGIGKEKSDVYILLDYKGTKLKTSIIECQKDAEVTYNEEFLVPA